LEHSLLLHRRCDAQPGHPRASRLARLPRLMDQSILLDETGRMLAVTGLICVVLLVPMMIIGLIISIIQAATSISEQTLSFVPKLIALGVCLVVFGSAAVELLTKFTGELFAVIARMGQ
jgi:flagellar biosynthetic protein FliQ